MHEEREIGHAPGFQIMSIRISNRDHAGHGTGARGTRCGSRRSSPLTVRPAASSSFARSNTRVYSLPVTPPVAPAIPQSTIAAITQPSPDLVGVQRDRWPNPEQDRPAHPDRDRDVADPRDASDADRRPCVSTFQPATIRDREEHERGHERERTEQVQREDPVVQVHGPRLWHAHDATQGGT